MLRLLKDPLIHFLLLGGLLFVLYSWRGEPDAQNPYQIVISDEEVDSMRQVLAVLHGRVPSRDELLETLEPIIKEEILYREAIALGLDRDDSQVRLRLTEKMLFLTQDVSEPVPPTDAELASFFADNLERFRVPAMWTFEQFFFSVSQHGTELVSVVTDALAELRVGTSLAFTSDALLFDARYEQLELAEVERLFGGSFAESLQVLTPNDGWQGPLDSDFGMHLVRVSEFVQSTQPEFENIRADVLSALIALRRFEANDAEYRKLRDRYEVVVNLIESPTEIDDVTGSEE